MSIQLNAGVRSPDVTPTPGAVVITALRAYVIAPASMSSSGGGADCHAQPTSHWIIGHPNPIANPMSMYPKYQQHRTSWGIDAVGSVIAEVELSNEGQDPRNIELMWDQMWRASINYGRKGLPLQAISAVDLALWDALGKLKNEPVYNLLGGKTKQRLPVYATTGRPDLAKAMGFVATKFPLPYGPADGDQGLRKNLERIAEVRKSVGPDFSIMVDCYMSLTVPYALKLFEEAKQFNVKWWEECLPPDSYDGYKVLRERMGSVTTSLLTTGEHEYTRWGFKQLLDNKCCDMLQPDITWCGGITEARRIVALASAYDIAIVPHGSSVYSFHLQYAFPNLPMAECLIMSAEADKIVPYFGALFTDEPLPKDGSVHIQIYT